MLNDYAQHIPETKWITGEKWFKDEMAILEEENELQEDIDFLYELSKEK